MSSAQKVLYIISGANGSGKSTLAEVLLKAKNLAFLNADEIAKEIAPDAIDSVPISAGKQYFKRLKTFFADDISFAVESTLSGNNIFRIINKAKSLGYRIILVYSFLPSCKMCIERVKKRVKNGGHNVPEEDIIRRYYKSIVKFWDEYRFEVDEWTIFYNGYDYSPLMMATGKGKNCVIMDNDTSEQFVKLYEFAKDEKNGL